MKRIFYSILLSLAVMPVINSCGDSGDNNKATIDVTEPGIIPVAGGTAWFDIISDSGWKIITSDKDDWFDLSIYEGSGEMTVTATAGVNEGAGRMANIDIIAGDRTKVVTLVQLGTEILEATEPPTVPATGGEVTFKITSNLEWTIADATDSWITAIAPKTGTGEATVTVTLDENPDAIIRTSTLTITGGELTKEVTVTQEAVVPKLVDELVGRWKSTGDYVYEFSPSKDEHIVTIEKIDDTTVRIIDLMGVATRFSNMTSEQDTFIATVDNEGRTVSIVPQPIIPTFSYDGLDVYLCRFLNDYSGGWDSNWQVGFDNIPVSDNMTIDFSAGGWHVGNWGGKPALASFIPLSQDPADNSTFFYMWYFTNTVWKKIN